MENALERQSQNSIPVTSVLNSRIKNLDKCAQWKVCKEPPKRLQDPVLWAWRKIFFIPKEVLIELKVS